MHKDSNFKNTSIGKKAYRNEFDNIIFLKDGIDNKITITTVLIIKE